MWHENKNIPSLKEQLFGGLCQDVLECECRARVELPVQNMPEIIPLQINGQNIESCLNSFFSPSEINWKCPNCGRCKVVKRTSIILEPFTLMLQLMRYKVDEVNQAVEKIHEKMISPFEITLPSGTSYTLNSVINHFGENTQEGHYTTLVYDNVRKVFFLLDDVTISCDARFQMQMSDQSYIFTYSKK